MPILLAIIIVLLPLQAPKTVVCTVPSTTYPTIQSAVSEPSCATVNISGGIFTENIAINRDVILSGAGADQTIINGGLSGSVLRIEASAVAVNDLTITNGRAKYGGGIFIDGGSLNITSCHIHANKAAGTGSAGGGLYSKNADVTITGSTISGNTSAFDGGGIARTVDGIMALNRVEVRDNIAKGNGGGIFNQGTPGAMSIDSSSLHGNKSTQLRGGAILNSGKLYINNSTISGNRSPLGGVIINWAGTMELSSTTVSANSGSPALERFMANSGVLRIRNTIVSGNPGGDCRGTIRSSGYNLIADTSECKLRSPSGDILGKSAKLAELRGMPAFHRLLPGLGVHQGNLEGCRDHGGNLLVTDQRGKPRNGRCDIGAFEYQGEYHRIYLPVCLNQP